MSTENCDKQDPQKFWRTRSQQYDKLQWASNGGLLHFFIEQCSLRSGMSVVDIGTGTGRVLEEIRQYFDVKMTGVDISQDMVQQAEEKLPDCRFVLNNVEDMALPDDQFDVATARMVFHHVENIQQGLKEIRRVLKPGGQLVFCEGVPPDVQVIDEYVRIFELKEKRHTFLESGLINHFYKAGYVNISLKPYFMLRVSLNDWLTNSGLPLDVQKQIYDLHLNGSPAFQDLYNIERKGDDLLMDWKFVVLTGEKPR
jgi:ubiquinone/menaquinone biosynthesis C-methylase UbiE